MSDPSPGAGWARDVRAVVDDLLPLLAAVPDDAWERPASGLTWTCRETAAHILDDLLAYAMQLSGDHGTGADYVPLAEAHQVREGGPAFWLWPEPASGSTGIAVSLDATAGVFAAVLASVPADRVGWHPWGPTDATGFAAMGLTETVLHAWELLTAQGVSWTADADVTARVLDRIFPAAPRGADPWTDLLSATGRAAKTRGMPWRWDAAVRG